MPTDDAPTLELLLRHQSLVRSIARDLLVDPDAADDVVQQTWLAALRHAARGAAVGRSLLARIATNLAFNRRRAARRRDTHEQRAAAAEPLPSVAELVEREDERRRVVDAVFALHEPLRETVLRRYLDDRSEGEVAAALDIPLGTVRTRLRRARALLRERLTRDGDEPRSARALVALAGWSADEAAAAVAGGTAGTSGTGVVLMGAKAWVGVAAGVALVAVLAWRFSADDRAAGADASGTSAVVQDGGLVARDSAPVEAPQIDGNATPVARTATATEVPPAKAGLRTATLRGRCVSNDGAPLGGVTVSTPAARASTITTREGRFALELDAKERSPNGTSDKAEITLTEAHHATKSVTSSVAPGASIELGDIELGIAGTIRGVVLDEADRPLAAEVVVFRGRPLHMPAWMLDRSLPGVFSTATTDSSGAFSVENLDEGWYSLMPILHEFTSDSWVPAAVTAAGSSEVIIRMRRASDAQRVAVVVLDEFGQPMPGVKLQWTREWESSAGSGGSGQIDITTDADGTCSLVVAERSVHGFEVRFPDGQIATATEVHGGDPPVTLRREVAPIASVSVVDDSTGVPCEGVDVAFIELMDEADRLEAAKYATPEAAEATIKAKAKEQAGTEKPAHGVTPMKSNIHHQYLSGKRMRGFRAKSDGAGVAQVPIPPGRFRVSAWHPEYESFAAEPFEGGVTPTLGPIRLRHVPRLRGTVTFADGPAADILVVVKKPEENQRLIEGVAVGRSGALAFTRTQSDGSFELPITASAQKAETLLVRAETPGFAPAEAALNAKDLVQLAVNDAASSRTVALRVTNGGAIEGRVTTSGERSPAGLVVTAELSSDDWASTRVLENGTYRLGALRPGSWRLLVSESEFDRSFRSASDPVFPEPDVTVAEEQTTPHDLTWSSGSTVSVTGSVRFGGAAQFGTCVRLCATDATTPLQKIDVYRPTAKADVGPSGAFRIDLPKPGTYLFATIAGDMTNELRVLRRVELGTGSNQLGFDLACGSVAGTCAHPNNGWVSLRGTLADGMELSIRMQCASDGSFTMPFVPVGHFRMNGREEIDVRAGETLTVDLK